MSTATTASTESEVQTLIGDFERDMRRCYRAGAKTSKSQAGKMLVQLGAAMHNQLLAHLEKLVLVSPLDKVEEAERQGWYLLLSCYAEDLHDVTPPNFPAAIEWLRSKTRGLS